MHSLTRPALALYCPDQNDSDPDTLAYSRRAGLLLSVTAWVDSSPVVTSEAFSSFVKANASNDRNGDWGHVMTYMTSDAGRVMVYVGADTWAALDENEWPVNGCTLAELRAVWGAMVWTPGDDGSYRLADVDGWDEWAPVKSSRCDRHFLTPRSPYGDPCTDCHLSVTALAEVSA